MWFLFGLVTLTSFCAFQAYKKVYAAWEGEKGSLDGVDYQYKFQKHKGKIQAALVGIEGPPGFDFTFKRERSHDRFFKHIGVAKEHQIGCSTFDDLVYVVSDDELLHMQVSLNNEISEAAIRLLSFQDNDGNYVKEVRCNSGRIWFHFPTSSDFEEEHVDFLARRLLSHLKAISDSLMKVGFRDKKACKDPFFLKAAVILAISSGLFFNGLAQSYRINLMDIPFTIDTALLRTDAIIYGSGILAIMVLATFYILGRSARTHLVLIELLLFGTAGVGLTMHAQLRDLNMDMDISAITEHAVHVYSKKKVSGRRSTSYYMNIDDWTDEQRRRKVEISGSFYAKISTGDKVLVQQRDGYLGYRWVENLTRL